MPKSTQDFDKSVAMIHRRQDYLRRSISYLPKLLSVITLNYRPNKLSFHKANTWLIVLSSKTGGKIISIRLTVPVVNILVKYLFHYSINLGNIKPVTILYGTVKVCIFYKIHVYVWRQTSATRIFISFYYNCFLLKSRTDMPQQDFWFMSKC